MLLGSRGPSYIQSLLASIKPAHTVQEKLYAQAEADRHGNARRQNLLANRKRRREGDKLDDLKIVRPRIQEPQRRVQEQLDDAAGVKSSSMPHVRPKLEMYTTSETDDAATADTKQTKRTEDIDQTTTMIGDHEVVETNVDPDELDAVYEYVASDGRLSPYMKMVYKIDPKPGKPRSLVRSIPNFELLGFGTMSGLPEVLFRVVHSESAGAVIMNGQGAHFRSQARKIHRTPSRFDDFEMADIADQIKRHVNGEKKKFSSHWLSTTDSFEHACVKAERHFQSKKVGDVKIYRINTRSLKKPALILLMYRAIRAWNVEDSLVKWRWDMFKHSTLTEWIIWDELDADDVEEIPYSTFSRPPQPESTRPVNHITRCPPDLIRIIPELAKTAAQKEDFKTGRGIPRIALHRKCYFTPEQRAEIQDFDEKVYAKRSGQLPNAPKVVQKDIRSNISTRLLDDIYAIAEPWRSRRLIFM